jgi:hypothetical protein
VVEKQQGRHRVIRGKDGDKMINLQRYWKALFLTSILILIGLLLFPSTVMAKASKQLESLIKQREWGKAFQIASPGGDAKLYHQVYMLRRFLTSLDNCIENPTIGCFKGNVGGWKGLVKELNKKPYFSKEFGSYLNSQTEALRTKYSQTTEELSKAVKEDMCQCKEIENALPPTPSSTALEKVFDCYAEVWAGSAKRYIYDFGGTKMSDMSPEMFELSERIEKAEHAEWALQEKIREEKRIKSQEEARIKREKEKEEKKRKEEKAFQAVSNKAAKLGYKKVLPYGIARFLYKVKHGKINLKEGLDALLWCKPESDDVKLDNLFEISQILEDAVIYHLSNFHSAKDELIEFTIIMPREDGALYMEGQKLSGQYFTYVGPFAYTTVLGARRTIQIFEPVKLPDIPK